MADQSKGEQLAELEVRRARTLSELEAIQAAVKSVHNSLLSFSEQQSGIMDKFAGQLEADGVPEAERQQLYKEWQQTFQSGASSHRDLVLEHERLHTQEVILVRTLAEFDAQIRALRAEMLK